MAAQKSGTKPNRKKVRQPRRRNSSTSSSPAKNPVSSPSRTTEPPNNSNNNGDLPESPPPPPIKLHTVKELETLVGYNGSNPEFRRVMKLRLAECVMPGLSRVLQIIATSNNHPSVIAATKMILDKYDDLVESAGANPFEGYDMSKLDDFSDEDLRIFMGYLKRLEKDDDSPVGIGSGPAGSSGKVIEALGVDVSDE